MGALGLIGCILVDFPPGHICTEGLQSRGRTKGGRRCKLESSLAEMCPTPRPNMMTGQKKKKKVQKTGLHKQPKLPLVDATLSELTCVLLQMYPAVSTLCFFHMHFASNDPPPFYFLTILISAEFFKEDENQSPFFCLSPPESAPNSSFKTCSADGIPYKRLSFALSTLLTAEGARDPSRNGGAFLGGCQ